MQRRLIYVDPVSGGHHASHLAFYLDRCAVLGVELQAVAPRQVWEQAQIERTRQGGGRLLREESRLPTGIGAKLDLLREIGAAADMAVGETAWFFPVLDDFLICLIPASMSGVVRRWSGVLFRDDFNYPRDELARPGKMTRSLIRYLALVLTQFSSTPGIGTLSPVWKAWLPRRPTWIPDALSISDQAEPPTGILTPRPRNDGRTRLLMFGAMAPRKGLVPMLKAIALAPPDRLGTIDLHIAGKFQDETMRREVDAILADIEKAGVRVSVEDRYLSNAELDDAIAACDLVLAPYQNHIGSSGVLGQAARFGKPILGQSSYQIGAEIRAFGLGVEVNSSSVTALRDGLLTLMAADPATFEPGQMRLMTVRNRATAAVALDGLITRLWTVR